MRRLWMHTALVLASASPLIVMSVTANAQQVGEKVIATDKAPKAVGPYSAAVAAGNMPFLSGQIAIDPQTNELVKGSIEDQTKQVLENLKAVLEAAGMSMANVVQSVVHMKDLSESPKMNTVYGTYFPQNPPARATVEVARLPRDVAVEISMIAVR